MTRKTKGEYRELELFDSRDWGLIIYDEVHLLPAPVFRMTSDLQSRRRLGLTATLVREDGREGDVFSLIGPKRYDAPWRDIEAQGWIAPADCVEVRVTMTDNERMIYAIAEAEERYRLCACARTKIPVVKSILERHPRRARAGHRRLPRPARRARRGARRPGDPGLDEEQGARARCSTSSGAASSRCWWCRRSRTSRSTCPRRRSPSRCPARSAPGRRRPSASAGILRPKGDGRQAHFYSVVARDTVDTEYAAHRQRFLAEQGYAYRIVDADDLLGPAIPDVPTETEGEPETERPDPS